MAEKQVMENDPGLFVRQIFDFYQFFVHNYIRTKKPNMFPECARIFTMMEMYQAALKETNILSVERKKQVFEQKMILAIGFLEQVFFEPEKKRN